VVSGKPDIQPLPAERVTRGKIDNRLAERKGMQQPSPAGMPGRKARNPMWRVLLGLGLASLLSMAGCSPPAAEQPEQILLRVGDSTVTLKAFQKRLNREKTAAAQGDEPVAAHDDADVRQALREMVEELLICLYARDQGITVSAAEVDQALDEIRGALPVDEFENLILESAQTPARFREGVYKRLLTAKAVQQAVLAQVTISTKDVERYFGSAAGHADLPGVNGGHSPPLPEELLRDIRRAKDREVYQQWLQGLRQQYAVSIDPSAWQALTGQGGGAASATKYKE